MTKRKYGAPTAGITMLRRAVSEDTGMPEWKCVHQLACMFIHEHPEKFHPDVVRVASGVSAALGLTLDWNKAGATVETMREYYREVEDPVEKRLKRLAYGQTLKREEDENE